MAGYLKPYRSYMFRNKDPIIDKMRTLIADNDITHTRISELSGVSTTTLYNWFGGKTRRPQFASLNAVARTMDCELALRKINGRGK